MTLNVGINGFGRMGRLALRAAWDNPDVALRARSTIRPPMRPPWRTC